MFRKTFRRGINVIGHERHHYQDAVGTAGIIAGDAVIVAAAVGLRQRRSELAWSQDCLMPFHSLPSSKARKIQCLQAPSLEKS